MVVSVSYEAGKVCMLALVVNESVFGSYSAAVASARLEMSTRPLSRRIAPE